MKARLKVYAAIDESACHAIYRVNRAFVEQAPPEVEFVPDVKRADLQVVHCFRADSLKRIHRERFVLVQHTLASSDITTRAVWAGIFEHALMVVSYLDLPRLVRSGAFNFYRTPWGVDTHLFQDRRRARRNAVLTSGWCCEGEAIHECYEATTQCGKKVVNLGADFAFGPGFTARSKVTDQELCDLYNTCEYVSGLRFLEGFELSVVEGLACGCRPICFDLPVYRHWFEDLAVFVPHCAGKRLVSHLVGVLQASPKPVTQKERRRVREKFDWKAISEGFWQRVCEGF